jgi:hypothetical protein
MGSQMTLENLRLIAGGALIGSVTAGALLGWIDMPFDPRLIGAGIGAAFSAIKAFHLL